MTSKFVVCISNVKHLKWGSKIKWSIYSLCWTVHEIEMHTLLFKPDYSCIYLKHMQGSPEFWIESVHELGWKWDSCFVCFSHYVLEPKTFSKQFFFIERHFAILCSKKEQRDYYMLWQASILCIKNLNTDTSKILYIDFIWARPPIW